MKIIKQKCRLFYYNKISYNSYSIFKKNFNREIQDKIEEYFNQYSLYQQYHYSQNKERNECIIKLSNILLKINQIRMKNWSYK